MGWRREKHKQDRECGVCKAIENYESKPREWTTGRKCAAYGMGIISAGILGTTFAFMAPGFRKFILPFVPASNSQMSNVLEALKGRSGSLIDIGSGDGRIVIAASKAGFKSDGVELNYPLVLYSRLKAYREGQFRTAKFFKKDLWKTDLSKYDNVVIFGVDTMMSDLEKKLLKELSSESAVVAARFSFPTWTPVKQVGEGLDAVWLYKPSVNVQR